MVLAQFRRWWSQGAADQAAGLSHPLPPQAGALVREIVDPTGAPMPFTDIVITAQDTNRVTARGSTDPYGLFLAALPPGRYGLLAVADGLKPHHEMIDIIAGTAAPAERIWLEPSEHQMLPDPGTWLFDPPHTAIRFIAQHVGMAHVHGRFDRFQGGIEIAQDMSQSRVRLRIDAASINTGNTTRDNHLRSADFLDVENFPHIEFASTRFVYRGGTKWSVQGALTMHGVSRSVALDTTYLGVVNGGYGEELRCAAQATAELHRDDFTLNWRSMLARGIAVVGPTVQLELDVQAMYRTHDTPTPPE